MWGNAILKNGLSSYFWARPVSKWAYPIGPKAKLAYSVQKPMKPAKRELGLYTLPLRTFQKEPQILKYL